MRTKFDIYICITARLKSSIQKVYARNLEQFCSYEIFISPMAMGSLLFIYIFSFPYDHQELSYLTM